MQSLDPTGDLVDNRFKILTQLGEGGFGAVYLAQQLDMDRKVALKFVHVTAADDPELLARFEREGRIIASLDHKNIVRCYAYGLWRNRIPYLALEFLEGKTLQQALKERRAIPWQEAFVLGIQICSALSAMHTLDLVHRDLKPDNIMLTNEGVLKLIDFGLVSVDGQRLTKSGAVVGSLLYLSPEQAYATKVTSASDIYSLGCVLYHLIAGQPPFFSDLPGEMLTMHARQEPRRLNDSVQDIPSGVEHVLFRAMQKQPDKRFSSASAFAAEMSALLQNKVRETHSIPSTGAATQHSARNIRVLLLYSTMALIIIAVTIATMTAYRQSADRLLTETATLEIEDELRKSRLLDRSRMVPYACRIGDIDKYFKAEELTPQMKKLCEEFRAERMWYRDRLAPLHRARAIANRTKVLSNSIKAELLLAEAKSWQYLPYLSVAAALLWSTETDQVLQRPIEKASIRAELHECFNGLRLELARTLYGSISHNLHNPIQTTAWPPYRAQSVISVENFMQPMVSYLSPSRDFADARWAVLLRNYAVLLSGTGRAKQAVALIEPFLRSERISSKYKDQLADGLAISQLGLRNDQGYLAAMQHLDKLVQPSAERIPTGADALAMYCVYAKETRNAKIAEQVLDLAIRRSRNEQFINDCRISRCAILAFSHQKTALKEIAKLPMTDPAFDLSRKSPKDRALLNLLEMSEALRQLGQDQLAIKYCEKAIPYSHNFASEGYFYKAIAEMRIEAKQYSQALPVLVKACTVLPASETNWFANCLMDVMHATRNYHQVPIACNAYEGAIATLPATERWKSYCVVAEKLADTDGHMNEAIIFATKALDAAKGQPNAEAFMHNILVAYQFNCGRLSVSAAERKLGEQIAHVPLSEYAQMLPGQPMSTKVKNMLAVDKAMPQDSTKRAEHRL